MFQATSHRLLLAAVALLIFGQVVAFWPSSTPPETPLSQQEARNAEERISRFRGFEAPDGLTPDYSIRNFRYVSVASGKKQWQLEADEAQFFSSQDTVLATDVQAELFSDNFSKTPSVRVTGKEARYTVSTRVLEVGGTVVARFPDGSEIHSEFLKFDPTRNQVFVPREYPVFGQSSGKERTRIEFRSRGLEGALDKGRFLLPLAVEVRVFSQRSSRGSPPAIFNAERGEIFKAEGLVRLLTSRPESKDGFVTLKQQGESELLARARAMEVRSFPGQAGKKPSFTALEDVRIEEWSRGSALSGKPYRHSTSGRAEFHPEDSEFILTEYPQVYQGDDTMTGDLIRVDRRNDRVEVENTNAISKGSYE